jgi:hypothetical protein
MAKEEVGGDQSVILETWNAMIVREAELYATNSLMMSEA